MPHSSGIKGGDLLVYVGKGVHRATFGQVMCHGVQHPVYPAAHRPPHGALVSERALADGRGGASGAAAPVRRRVVASARPSLHTRAGKAASRAAGSMSARCRSTRMGRRLNDGSTTLARPRPTLVRRSDFLLSTTDKARDPSQSCLARGTLLPQPHSTLTVKPLPLPVHILQAPIVHVYILSEDGSCQW